MAAANYQASKARNQFIETKRKQEEWEIDHMEEQEKEELGLIEDGKNPLDNSVSTFIGFNVIGLIPLIPFMIFMIMKIDANSEAFVYSTISVIVSFFLVGMIKGKIVKKPKIRSGFYTLIIGGIASLVAYFVGYGLKILIQ
jgi:VIT1/CCC1 family predicted Fe2+/Mn2+ transporter